MAGELVPAFDGALLEFGERADDFEIARIVRIFPDRQREAPVALLGDHPVAHVGQPFQLAFLALDFLRQPFNLPRDVLNLLPPIHIDEPLIDEPEDEFVAGPPAERVDVRIFLDGDEEAFLFQVFDDQVDGFWRGGLESGELAETVEEASFFVERRDVKGVPILGQ